MLYCYRSNSKASYLPRQSHENLTADPDHGSYKLTLNSNEDCIHLPHNTFHGQLHSTKMNNLPDVLPLGVKIKGVAATRYGSANGNALNELSNGAANNESLKQRNGNSNSNSPMSPTTTVTTPTTPSAYSLKSMFNFHNNNNNSNSNNNNNSSNNHHHINATNNIKNKANNCKNGVDQQTSILTMSNNQINQRHQTPPALTALNGSYQNGTANQMMNSTIKYMSQSTIDLKRAHQLFNNDPSIFNNGINTRITNTESMGNLLNCTSYRQSSPPNLHSALVMNTNEHGTLISNSSLTVAQHNAMNMNGLTQSPTSPITINDDEKMIRCDSLKENIDKISQSQTKLSSPARIHNEITCESINSYDAFNDSLSTDDSSTVSQFSSESISSVESLNSHSNGLTKESANDKSDTELHLPHRNETNEATNGGCDSQITQVPTTKLNESQTSEVGSQTDESILDGPTNGLPITNGAESLTNAKPTKTTIITRTKFADEFDCKKLSESLVEQLSPNDRLRNILGKKHILSN